MRFIGFYNYTVWLTYISLLSGAMGIMLACGGHAILAVVCLALSGLLDAFDGKVARTKKDRTEAEKQYGIELDSLCDLVCFGALPVAICWRLGMRGVFGVAILLFYILAGLIRLAWFNVTEEERQQETSENRHYYQGLPITSIAVILPVFYAGSVWMGEWFLPALHVLMLVVGLLFILNFRFCKPDNKTLVILIVVTAAAVLFVLVRRHFGGYVPGAWRGRLSR